MLTLRFHQILTEMVMQMMIRVCLSLVEQSPSMLPLPLGLM